MKMTSRLVIGIVDRGTRKKKRTRRGGRKKSGKTTAPKMHGVARCVAVAQLVAYAAAGTSAPKSPNVLYLMA
jgi:hypothetical protein